VQAQQVDARAMDLRLPYDSIDGTHLRSGLWHTPATLC